MKKRHSHAFVVWPHQTVRSRMDRDVHRFTHRHVVINVAHVHRLGPTTDEARYYDEEGKF